MACGCAGSKTVEYVFTPPNGGAPQVFSKQIQAQVAQMRAKGGTITTRPKQ